MAMLKGWELFDAVKGCGEFIYMWGPKGTAKTTTACLTGEIVYQTTMTEQTPFAEFRGHFVLKGADTQWHDGIGVRWWTRNDALLVINEIDQASDDCLTGLRALLDDKEIAFLTLPDGRTVHPTGGQRCIATSNVNPDELPEPLKDRFPVRIYIDEPHPAALAALPEDLRESAKISCKVTDPQRAVSLRGWFSFARLRASHGEEVAAAAVFGARGTEILNALRIAATK